jgi:hypothetical protein
MIYVLRLLHILSGAFWYGTAIFGARFLMPSLRDAGPAAGPVVAQLNRRKMPMAMMGAGIVNIGSGIWLMFMASGGSPGVWMRTGMGRTFAIGGALAILALIYGMIVSSPAAKRMGEVASAAAKRGGPPSPEEAAELARLQKRLGLSTIISATLMTLAVAAMAVARYLP